MYKIDELLKEYDSLPNQQYWDELENEFKVKYREFQAIRETLPDAENEITDKSLVDLLYKLHDFKEIDETEPIVPVQPIEPVQSTVPETGIPIINENETETEGDMKKTKKQSVQIHSHASQPIEIKTETPEIPETPETQETVEPQNIVTNPEQTEEFVQQVTPPIQQNPYQEFEQWATAQETVSASDMKKFNIPAEMWKVNKVEITIGSIRLRKFVGGLYFNKWQVVKN
jgi:hypothetical protein